MFRSIIISCWFLGFVAEVAIAQDTTIATEQENNKMPSIRWISQFPSLEDLNKKQGFFNRLGDLLFSKKQAAISRPISILAKNDHFFWVLDQGNGTIVQVDKSKRKNYHLLTNKHLHFNSLVGICDAGERRILFTDSRLNKIVQFTEGKKGMSILNDSLLLQRPTGIAYSKINNEIWVVETGAHRIAVLNENGSLLKTIGKRGTAPGEFNFPTFIWIDKSGNVYVVDSMNFRVQIFNAEGQLIALFGENGDATGYFSSPKGIATDSHGNIYVVDALFHAVQVFDQAGNFLYYFGKQGRDKEQFWIPAGIYIDEQDFIYIADSYNSRIQVFQLINPE